MDTPKAAVPSLDVEQRRCDVENTLGSLRIEGFELDEAARALLARYVAGEITLDDVGAVLTRHPQHVAEDPYLYSGTSVLKNLPGIRDAEELRAFEGRASAFRVLEVQRRPLVGSYDRAHLQAIHKHIFQDVFEWAGQPRTVEIAKPGSPFFAFQRFVVPSLDTLTAQLKAEGHLRGLSADDFAIRAGYYLGEVNAIHPFREGNGRAQQEFVRALALQAGHRIAWANVLREQMYAASKVSFERADSSGLAAVIDIAIDARNS